LCETTEKYDDGICNYCGTGNDGATGGSPEETPASRNTKQRRLRLRVRQHFLFAGAGTRDCARVVCVRAVRLFVFPSW